MCSFIKKILRHNSSLASFVKIFQGQFFFFVDNTRAGVHEIRRPHHMHQIQSQSAGDLLIRCVLSNYPKFEPKKALVSKSLI